MSKLLEKTQHLEVGVIGFVASYREQDGFYLTEVCK